MTRFMWLVLVLAGASFAQPQVTRGGALKKRQYQTYGNMTLYVGVDGGSDSNACVDGAAPCATVNGALTRVPKNIRHVVTVNLAGGTYTENVVMSGYSFSGNGSLIVQGTEWTNAPLDGGSNTGTVTSYTAPSVGTVTLGSVADTGQSWVTDALKGYYVNITSGAASGTQRVIVGNTATSLSINSAIAGLTAGATYAIQRPAASITSSTASGITFFVNGLSGGSSTTPVILSDLELTNTSGAGVGAIALRIASTSATNPVLLYSVLLRRLRVVPVIGTAVSLSNSRAGTSSASTFAYNLAMSNSTYLDNGGYWFLSGSGRAVYVSSGSTYSTSANAISVVEAASGVALDLAGSVLTAGSISMGTYLVALLRSPSSTCLDISYNNIALSQATRFESCSIGVRVARGGVFNNTFTTPAFTTTTTEFSIDGDTYSLATINALSPKRVVGTQGSTVLLQ